MLVENCLFNHFKFLGAVQTLRNVQRGEGVTDFVTYRYVYFEGGGGILWHSYVTADTQFENSKRPISFRCAVLFSLSYSLVAKTLTVALHMSSVFFHLSISLYFLAMSSVCVHMLLYMYGMITCVKLKFYISLHIFWGGRGVFHKSITWRRILNLSNLSALFSIFSASWNCLEMLEM